MARPKGSRDRAYEERRRALLALARAHLGRPHGRQASWRELAVACGVSVSTMGHYFGNRQTLIAAILSQSASEGAGHLERAATPDGPFELSIPQLVGQIAMGLERGVLDLQVIGLGEGFADTGVASAYLGHHLDPIIAAVARRLDAHVAAGEMLEVDTRHAALGLVAPLLLAFLHQHALGGAGSAPLELQALAEAHAAAFVRAYARRTATAP